MLSAVNCGVCLFMHAGSRFGAECSRLGSWLWSAHLGIVVVSKKCFGQPYWWAFCLCVLVIPC